MQNESARCFELGSPTLLGSTIAEVLVEHFRFSPESSDAMRTKSITHVCKHSLRTQINRYDQRTEPDEEHKHYATSEGVVFRVCQMQQSRSTMSDHNSA